MSTTELAQDDVFELLSSARRRYVLYLLREESQPVELTTLAEHVAAWENETTVEEITEQERKRVYVSLYQTHIPRLDEAGLIEYEKETGMVELESVAREMDMYLESTNRDLPWHWVYLSLAVTGALLVILSVFNILWFEAADVAVVTGAVVLVFALTAIAHTVYRVRDSRSVPNELQKRL